MADEYDLAPKDEPKKPEDSLPVPPGTPEGFVPPKVIIEGPDEEPPSPEEIDASENHASAAAAYLLFALPLIYAPKSQFARFHANQALVLQIHTGALVVLLMVHTMFKWLSTHVEALQGIVGITSCFVVPVLWLLIVLMIVLAVQQAMAAMDQLKKKTPVIGNLTLLKTLPEENVEQSAD